MNVSARVENKTGKAGIGAKYPYLVAWVGFNVLSILPNFVVQYLVGDAGFIAKLALYGLVGYFIFKFVVKQNVLKYMQANVAPSHSETA